MIIHPDPQCTIARIRETLRRRASAHEAIARHFRKAMKQLNPSVQLLGDADADLARVNANLRAQIRELWNQTDRLESENSCLLAQVLGDDPPVESDKVFTAFGEQFVSNLAQALDYDSIAVTAAKAAE